MGEVRAVSQAADLPSDQVMASVPPLETRECPVGQHWGSRLSGCVRAGDLGDLAGVLDSATSLPPADQGERRSTVVVQHPDPPAVTDAHPTRGTGRLQLAGLHDSTSRARSSTSMSRRACRNIEDRIGPGTPACHRSHT